MDPEPTQPIDEPIETVDQNIPSPVQQAPKTIGQDTAAQPIDAPVIAPSVTATEQPPTAPAVEIFPEPIPELPPPQPVDIAPALPIPETAPIEPPANQVPTIPEPVGVAQQPSNATPAEPDPPLATPTPLPVATTPPQPQTPQDQYAKIYALSDEELRFAATYYLQKNQKTISAKGVQARKQQMETNLNTIFLYIRTHGPSPLPRIAKHANCSPGTTSHYLQILIQRGMITATGWASRRLYQAN